MERKEAFATACTLLEQSGDAGAVAAMKRALETLEAYETHGKTLSDVTRALLESEKTYRLVFSQEIDAIALFDAETEQIVEVNASWTKLYGYTREEALALNIRDLRVTPEGEPRPSGPAARIDVQWHRAKDGTVFPVDVTPGRLVKG